MSRPKPFSVVPWPAYLLALLGLVVQLLQHAALPLPQARIETLPEPIPVSWLRVLSLGEPAVLAKVLMLWLQAFDYQAGVALALRDLDQERLEGWLGRFLDLDPRAQYPLMAAVRFYGDLSSPQQQRRFAAFAYRRFFADPNRRWPWLAHAAILAKHRLHNLPLAWRYAHAIRVYTTGDAVPSWAKQMEIVVLEDMGEKQRARQLIQALLADGTVRDPREIHFLEERLRFLGDCSAQTCKGEKDE